MAITSSGVVIRIAVDDIVLYGRATQGVIIMKVHGKDEKVVFYNKSKIRRKMKMNRQRI